jgi:hypothetical protein
MLVRSYEYLEFRYILRNTESISVKETSVDKNIAMSTLLATFSRIVNIRKSYTIPKILIAD